MSITANPLTLRITRWIAGRDGPEAGDVLLDRRRVYILPTVPGLAFGVAVLLLLIGSINYSLQLGFLLTFLVASMAVVGMHSTHSNLVQLVLRGVRVEPVFAGDVAVFEITVSNPGTLDRFALRFAFVPAATRARRKRARDEASATPPTVSVEVPARGLRTVLVPLPAPVRGRLPAPRITVETRFPFGLWRAWAYLTPALAAIVYPKPEEDAPPLPAAAGGHGETVGMARRGDDFAGVRPYQPGDSQKLIAWRLAARSDELSVKQFDAAGGGDLVLDFDTLPTSIDLEHRVSRLTRWVLDADAAHMRYGLHLPDAVIDLGSGVQHRDRCLTALAVCTG
ncbi:MAG TPA: DUF58 domain-containing protein [Burkholderiaceae bacterium]|nr:DUF58 domain-containing protein [Burkholderiaceae bacterium]